MSTPIPPELLVRLRLAAQRLSPQAGAADSAEAARSVLGLQAQDVRAAGLAIRSRVAGVTREEVDAAPLVRTWTVRGTAHLVAASDLSWLTTLTGPRNRRRFDGLMAKRENLETARRAFEPAIEILAEAPMTRARLIELLGERGLPSLGDYSINILMPWLASSGRVVGLADGTFRAVEPPPEVDVDEALATLGTRYLEGYGPASAGDLARWSGLPVTKCRRALEAAGPLERHGDLLAFPGTLEAASPAPPTAQLLGAFDTAMLGWSTREPVIAAEHDYRIGGGAGMIRAMLLVAGRGAATWRLEGSGRRRKVRISPFSEPLPSHAIGALEAEVADVGRFLGLDLHLAS